ncbi:MAG: hypothetical protein LBQ77_05885 [Treponema sp.]|jgi:hypothetical protein|nr:hypothetical protein [Treponema sp.]
MDILLNGEPLNVTLEQEKTFGDVLCALEEWLHNAHLFIITITVNGTQLTDGLDQWKNMDVKDIHILDLKVQPWSLLTVEALYRAKGYIEDYSAGKTTQEAWENSATRQFLAEQIPSIIKAMTGMFKGNQASDTVVQSIERMLREILEPEAEILSMEPHIHSLVKQLEDLPLFMQLGKNSEVTETVTSFAQTAETLFHVTRSLQDRGLSIDESLVDRFKTTLVDFFNAYNNSDIVLVGDLAEYELSPLLSQWHSMLKHTTNT